MTYKDFLEISDVIHVPLECVQTGSDSIPFVYLKNGTRQVVLLGESNENSVIIEQGLEGDESIFLSTPESPEKFKMAGVDLIEINRQRAKEKREEEAKAREEAARSRQRPAPAMEGITPEMMQRFQERRGSMPGRGSGDSLAIRRMNAPAGSSQQGAPQTSASRQSQTGQSS